jgi:VWFA-related protein
MKTRISLAIILSGFLAAQSFAQSPAGQDTKATEKPAAAAPDKQTPPQADKPKAAQKEDVVKISVTLVQVDAVVTDSKGRQVTDLKPEDFEIYQDGRRQQISNFSYVSLQPATASPAPAPNKSGKNAPLVPPVNLRPEQVRRTMALVVDDLGLSFESTASLRYTLKKYVDEQMQPGDLVAIIRTGAGMGALQQFTGDKRQLYAAIERVRWNPMGRGGVSAFGALQPAWMSAADRTRRGSRSNGDAPVDDQVLGPGETLDQFREDLFTVGTLGALNYVVRGLRELPGRKSVVLFSDGLRMFTSGRDNRRVVDALRRLTDLANRASVVIYTIDARGLQVPGLTAADDVSGRSDQEIRQEMNNRRQELFDSQDGLNYLARETGGFFVYNSNDLNRGMRRVMDDQQGYYLIGYTPEADTFRLERGVRKYHKFSMKVKRAGLNVRTRTGFIGIPDTEARPTSRTPAQQITAALTSPFNAGDVHLKLTSLFGHDPKLGAFMRSLLHIDPRDLTFTEEGGKHKAVVDIVAVTFGDTGQMVDQESRTYTLEAPEDVYQKVMRQGFLYTVLVPIKKPGAYQLRVAVRDHTSEHIGSANQFIEVPDIKKNRLALSGIVVSGTDPTNQKKTDASAPPQADNTTEGATDEVDPQLGPAVRKLRRRMFLDYGMMIYNARLDKTTQRPQLEAQVILLHDGKPVYTGKVNPVNVSPNGQSDWQHIAAGGRLQLGTDMEPGDYVLQVIVVDKLTKEKSGVATQWTDFEIVP